MRHMPDFIKLVFGIIWRCFLPRKVYILGNLKFVIWSKVGGGGAVWRPTFVFVRTYDLGPSTLNLGPWT